MARRKRNRDGDDAEALVKLSVGAVCLLALSIGGVTGFAKAFAGLLYLALFTVFGVSLVVILVLLGRAIYRRHQTKELAAPPKRFIVNDGTFPAGRFVPTSAPSAAPRSSWTPEKIEAALDEIDWYQFEKFCAALLKVDGFTVQRMGGAQPDGGVDLVVEKDGGHGLIQCKHWRTWVVQEKVVREMLGSMTHFKVTQGAIYTLKGWTIPAARFAAEHDITLVNGAELAASASSQLPSTQLDELLASGIHHCPKCEAPMVERKGAFKTFWGCSNYGRTRCRGKFAYLGAR